MSWDQICFPQATTEIAHRMAVSLIRFLVQRVIDPRSCASRNLFLPEPSDFDALEEP